MILHITTKEAWQTAVDNYIPEGFAEEGFIHCSTVEQVLKPANEMFHGRRDLILLCIDEEIVQAEVLYEDCYETGQAFPHIYGPLNTSAVVEIVDFPSNKDGSFSLPPGLNLP
jgi:uncharacterized protein (DUF952 family)